MLTKKLDVYVYKNTGCGIKEQMILYKGVIEIKYRRD